MSIPSNASLKTLSSSRFRILKVLGQGSFGTAFLVEDLESCINNKYVIKKIDISKLDNKSRSAALVEVEVLSRLSHPNIVAYYGSWIEGDPHHLHILLEYCDRGDLSQAIRERKDKNEFFSEQQITSWFVQLSSAILFCHRMRILHRDLKTSNIFLHGPSKVVKLADFGIARVLQSEGSLASTVIGTPYYMSPELVNNESYSYKSDVWALGCVLYEMATLKHAFDAGNMCALVLSILRGKYTPLSQNQYSMRLGALIDSMLQLEPSRRPTMEEVLTTEFVQEALVLAIQNEEGVGRLHVARAHNALAAVPDVIDNKVDYKTNNNNTKEVEVKSNITDSKNPLPNHPLPLPLPSPTVPEQVTDEPTLETNNIIKKDDNLKTLSVQVFDDSNYWSVGPTDPAHHKARRMTPNSQSLLMPNLEIDVSHTGRLDAKKRKPPSLERYIHERIRSPMPGQSAFRQRQNPEDHIQKNSKASATSFGTSTTSAVLESDQVDSNGWGSTVSGDGAGGPGENSSRSDDSLSPFPKIPFAVSYPTHTNTSLTEIQTAMNSIKQEMISSTDLARVIMFVGSRDITSTTTAEDISAIRKAREILKSNELDIDSVEDILSTLPEYASYFTPERFILKMKAKEELQRQRSQQAMLNLIESAKKSNRDYEKLISPPKSVMCMDASPDVANFILDSPPRPRNSRNSLDIDEKSSTTDTQQLLSANAISPVELSIKRPVPEIIHIKEYTSEPLIEKTDKPVSLLVPQLPSLPLVACPVGVTILGRGRRTKGPTTVSDGGGLVDPLSSKNLSKSVIDRPVSDDHSLLHDVNNLRASMVAATLVMNGANDYDDVLPDSDSYASESTVTLSQSARLLSCTDESRSALSDRLVRTASEEKRFWSRIHDSKKSRDSTPSQSSPRMCNEARDLVASMIEEKETITPEHTESLLHVGDLSKVLSNPLPHVTVLTIPEELLESLPSCTTGAPNRHLDVFSASTTSRSSSPSARTSLLKPIPAPRRTSLAGIAWTLAQSELATAATHLQIATNLREMVAPHATNQEAEGFSTALSTSVLSERPPPPPPPMAPSSILPFQSALDEKRPVFKTNRKPRRHSTGSNITSQTFHLKSLVPTMASHLEEEGDNESIFDDEYAPNQMDEANDRTARMNAMRERCIRELGGREKFDEVILILGNVMLKEESQVLTLAEEAHSSELLGQLIKKHGALIIARLSHLHNLERI
jgi:serine/threonine protein kinase